MEPLYFFGEHRRETGQAVADAIVAYGGRATFVETDITDKAQVARLVETTWTQAGGVDILVNNAGANMFYEPLEMPDEAWKQCMDLDLDAAWTCSRAVLPAMLAQGGGVIINIASAHSFKIIPDCFPIRLPSMR